MHRNRVSVFPVIRSRYLASEQIFTHRKSLVSSLSTFPTTVRREKSTLQSRDDDYSSLKRLIKFSKSEWRWIGLSASTLGVTSSITLLIPHASGFVVDYTINNQGSDGYSPLILASGLFGLTAIAGGGVYLRSIWLARAGNRIVARLKQQLYSSILKQETAFLDVKKSSTGDLISRLTQDATCEFFSFAFCLSCAIFYVCVCVCESVSLCVYGCVFFLLYIVSKNITCLL